MAAIAPIVDEHLAVIDTWTMYMGGLVVLAAVAPWGRIRKIVRWIGRGHPRSAP